jgi:signal transduction histidine kinase
MTLRIRLTVLYGGLFLAAGLALLGVTYLLIQQQLKAARPPGQGQLVVATGDGTFLTGKEADAWFENQQAALREAATTSLLTQGSVALALVGGAAVGLGWLVAGNVLTPLHRVTDTARRIAASPTGLHERILLSGPADEVKELADAFDVMVERLHHSFDGQRRFVANASHELRTPLTLNRALVELAMHRKSATPDVKQLGESLLEINTRHERLITGLLLLARSEQEIAERSPVDMADVVSHVVEQTTFEAKEACVTVDDLTRSWPVNGDALLLERLVHNLVENGIRHNHPDGWVRVITTGSGLEVSNSGPIVPAFEIPALFEPFRRLGTDRMVTGQGAGLGMSIALSIARAHGGDLTARPRTGGGLVVVANLPRATT